MQQPSHTDKLSKLYETYVSLCPKLGFDLFDISAVETAASCSPPLDDVSVKKLKKSAKCCSLCGEKSSSYKVAFNYEPNERFDCLKASSPLTLCGACISVRELGSVLSVVAGVSTNPQDESIRSKLANVAAHFLRVNGHDLSDKVSFHNALSFAIALKVHCGGLRVKC